MMTDASLYAYQRRVRDLVLSGRPVVLQAPTGAGKTRAALEPFFHAFANGTLFPRQAIYSVPMRTLANQFVAEYRQALAQRLELAELRATIQTSEHPEDPELWGDLVFTTIDQTLSNWLCVPYSLGAGRANLNAGAIVGSYLVFDEFHLFPLDDPAKGNGARVTTLALLKSLNGLVPWVLMTATFSRKLLDELCTMLGAECVLTDPDDLAEIPSQRSKLRVFQVQEKHLEPGDILDNHIARSIAVCNTVDRAVELYQGLCQAGCRPVPFSEASSLEEIWERILDAPGAEATHVMLLHSRFESTHRGLKEKLVLQEFGRNTQARKIPSLILVATQVVEVGLNITCETLHTEIAPAASLLQRAGRCARFQGEKGHVQIYDLPDSGRDRYAPYTGADEDLCRKAWDAFRARSGSVIDFQGEQQVVDEVHTEADRQLLDAIQRRERELWVWIIEAIRDRDVSRRGQLIRQVDNRVLLVHDQPEVLGDPFACTGFSVWRGTIASWWHKAKVGSSLGLPWQLQYPVAVEEKNQVGQRTTYTWRPVEQDQDLFASTVLVIHPQLVRYDAETGLRFGPSTGQYRTQPPEAQSKVAHFQYRLETYPSHVQRMAEVYWKRIAPRLHYLFEALGARLKVAPETLRTLMAVTLAVHDAGKLSQAWQRWAHDYQARIGHPVPEDVCLAHTDLITEEHQAIERQMRSRRPNHAVEGAACCASILRQAAGGNEFLLKAALMTVAKHHSPGAEELGEIELAPRAQQELAEALRVVAPPGNDLSRLAFAVCDRMRGQQSLGRSFLQSPVQEGWEPWFLYFLMVRALRLADGAAVEATKEVVNA